MGNDGICSNPLGEAEEDLGSVPSDANSPDDFATSDDSDVPEAVDAGFDGVHFVKEPVLTDVVDSSGRPVSEERRNRPPATPFEIAESKENGIAFREGDSPTLQVIVLSLTIDRIRDRVAKLNKEMALEDPSVLMEKFESDYGRWSPELQSMCSWEDVRAKLLANDGYFIKRAVEIEGAALFGVDKDGKILVASETGEPSVKGKNYREVLHRVSYEYDAIKDRPKLDRNGKKIPAIGREFFPYAKGGETGIVKSEEVLMLEDFTGRPAIRSTDGTAKYSYLYTGEDPDQVAVLEYNPLDDIAVARFDAFPIDSYADRGALVLLRIS
ncbi:hypothetical protein M0P48_03940 [Candidatus Gracilibacteria bacterium]|nr:hypothetical protein [Candidatus Gracilibacteria bacterium]